MSIDTQRVQFENKLRELLEALGTGETIQGGTILSSRLSIINYVKAKLDELVPEGEGVTFNLSSEPNTSNPYDLLINAHIDEATKNVIMSAPLSVLKPYTSEISSGTSYTDTKIGFVVLPSDFLRLSAFRMMEWEREVTIPLSMEDPDYKNQTNIYLRGGICKPKAVLKWKNHSVGGLKTVSISAGGAGFSPGVNTLTVSQSEASGGTIKVIANSSGIITSVSSVITVGSGYSVATGLTTSGGTGTGCTVNLTAIDGMRRILDYFSVNDSHDIETLLYIPEKVAEDFVSDNPNLLDALAWMTAGKIMQIIGQLEPAKLAAEQVKLSYNNL